MDGVTKWIRYLYKHYPEIKNHSTLQGYIEHLFESKFDSEIDQIGFMRQLVSSDIYRRQHQSFKKKHTMRGHDFNSSALRSYMMMDGDELNSDGEDADGGEIFDSSDMGEEYFSGVFKHFVTGLRPSLEEAKNAPSYSVSGTGGASLT